MLEIATFYHQLLAGVTEKNLTLDEAMEQIRSHAITKVDVNSDYLLKEEPELFAKRLRSHGIGIVSVHGIVPCDVKSKESFESSVAEMKNRIALAKRAGSEFFMLVPNKAESFSEDDYEKYADGVLKLIGECGAYAKEIGIQATVENFSRRDFPYTSFEGIEKILKTFPHIRYTYDSGNYTLAGFNEMVGVKIFCDKTVYAHLKEFKPSESETPYLWDEVYYEKVPFGDGIVRNYEAVEYLIKKGYRGDFAVELYDSKNVFDNTLISADRLKEKIEQIKKEVGIE